MDTLLLEDKSTTYFYEYLKAVIKARLMAYFEQEEYKAPVLPNTEIKMDALYSFITFQQLDEKEIVFLLLALVPDILPNFLNQIIEEHLPNGGDFPEFGGVKGKNHRGIIPTGETALYILAGNDVNERTRVINFIFHESKLFRESIVEIEVVPKGEPRMSGKLMLSEEYVHLFLTGKELKPSMSAEFPASQITTDLEWDDLVLDPKTDNEVKEIEHWLKHNDTLLNDWGMKSKIKPGYRVLFCGPPGTGKTLTAGLLGKYTKKDVYRVDLSMIVSKYIGETEKNLSKLFDKAINKDWILFFDEADAIFGKRTNVRDAHDKYANQEVSYLLQRIEAHPSLVILATNFKNNIDNAFTRRFQSIIEFDLPSYNERIQLWKKSLPKEIQLAEDLVIDEVAKKFAISGANIMNVVQYACLKTLSNQSTILNKQVLIEGIKKEYAKEGKTISV